MTFTERWYRIEVGQDGKVVSCELAEKPEEDNGLIFYVRAKDQRHAGRLAFNAYMLAITRARHAQYDREGKCRCGRKRDVAGRRWCSVCLEANKVYKDRSRKLAAGKTAPEKAERRDVIALRKEQDAQAIRVEAFRTVLRWALTLKPGELIRKLQEEIVKIAGRDAA